MKSVKYKGEYKGKFWTKRFIILKLIDLFYGSMIEFVDDINLKITKQEEKSR